MLEAEDIKKLTEYQLKAYKEVFLTKEDGKEIRADVQKLQADVSVLKADVFVVKEDQAEMKVTMNSLETKIDKVQNSLDAVLKDKQTRDQEVLVLNHRMKNTEDLLDKAAPKLGLDFKH
jgi:chromosome segregation ATPase